MTEDEGREILSRLHGGWKFLLGRNAANGDYELRELYAAKGGSFTVRDTRIPADANSRSRSESKTLGTEQVLAFLGTLDFRETRERLRPPPKPSDAIIEVSPDMNRPHEVIGVFQVGEVTRETAIEKLSIVARREGADAIDDIRQSEIRFPGKPARTIWQGKIVRWISA